MPRHKSVPDEQLLDAALSLMRARGPAGVTFSALADRVGLASATLVQRFGSKAGLLRATLERAWDLLDVRTDAALARAGEGVDAIVVLVGELSATYDDDPAEQLLVLREDLRDPDLRARGARWFARLADEIDDRLPAGRLGGADVVALWQGTVTLWMFRRDAPLHEAVEACLRRALATTSR